MLLRRRVVERGVWRVATWTHIGDESGCKGREAMGVGGSRGTRQQRGGLIKGTKRAQTDAFCARPARLAEHGGGADVKIKEKGFKIIFILLTNYHMNR